MARTSAGTALTASHAQLQRTVTASTLRLLLQLWPAVDTRRPTTFDAFNQAATILVLDGYRKSSGLAAAYYAGFRIAEGFVGEARTPLASPPPVDRVKDLLRAAAVVGILRARSAGRDPVDEQRQGWVQLSGQASSLVLNGGRHTVLGSVEADPQARGYQRVTASPCAFCAMLASRGAVYTTEFQAHDHCQCSIEPAFPGTQMPARSAEYRSLWDATTEGLSGSDAFNAFRREVEAPAPDAMRAAA